MNLPDSLPIHGGHLYCGGVDTVELAKKFGTPLYVTNETHVIKNFRSFEAALKAYTDSVQLLYAVKANENPVLIQTLAREGAGAYGYAMSSQYNNRPRCPEVLVNEDKAELMRRAETYENMTTTVVYPSWHRK